MLTQCAVSGVDLVISLIYIIMGTITIQQLLPFVIIPNIPFCAVKGIFRALYNRNREKWGWYKQQCWGWCGRCPSCGGDKEKTAATISSWIQIIFAQQQPAGGDQQAELEQAECCQVYCVEPGAAPAGECWRRLELEKNLREVWSCIITEGAPTLLLTILCDCESSNFAKVPFHF